MDIWRRLRRFRNFSWFFQVYFNIMRWKENSRWTWHHRGATDPNKTVSSDSASSTGGQPNTCPALSLFPAYIAKLKRNCSPCGIHSFDKRGLSLSLSLSPPSLSLPPLSLPLSLSLSSLSFCLTVTVSVPLRPPLSLCWSFLYVFVKRSKTLIHIICFSSRRSVVVVLIVVVEVVAGVVVGVGIMVVVILQSGKTTGFQIWIRWHFSSLHFGCLRSRFSVSLPHFLLCSVFRLTLIRLQRFTGC